MHANFLKSIRLSSNEFLHSQVHPQRILCDRVIFYFKNLSLNKCEYIKYAQKHICHATIRS